MFEMYIEAKTFSHIDVSVYRLDEDTTAFSLLLVYSYISLLP